MLRYRKAKSSDLRRLFKETRREAGAIYHCGEHRVLGPSSFGVGAANY